MKEFLLKQKQKTIAKIEETFIFTMGVVMFDGVENETNLKKIESAWIKLHQLAVDFHEPNEAFSNGFHAIDEIEEKDQYLKELSFEMDPSLSLYRALMACHAVAKSDTFSDAVIFEDGINKLNSAYFYMGQAEAYADKFHAVKTNHNRSSKGGAAKNAKSNENREFLAIEVRRYILETKSSKGKMSQSGFVNIMFDSMRNFADTNDLQCSDDTLEKWLKYILKEDVEAKELFNIYIAK